MLTRNNAPGERRSPGRSCLDSVGIRIDSQFSLASRRGPRGENVDLPPLGSIRNAVGPGRLLERLPETVCRLPTEAARRSAPRRDFGFDRLASGAFSTTLAGFVGLRLADGLLARCRDGFRLGRCPHVRFGIPFRSVPDHRVRDDGEFPRHRDDDDLAGLSRVLGRLAKAARGGLHLMADIAAWQESSARSPFRRRCGACPSSSRRRGRRARRRSGRRPCGRGSVPVRAFRRSASTP